MIQFLKYKYILILYFISQNIISGCISTSNYNDVSDVNKGGISNYDKNNVLTSSISDIYFGNVVTRKFNELDYDDFSICLYTQTIGNMTYNFLFCPNDNRDYILSKYIYCCNENSAIQCCSKKIFKKSHMKTSKVMSSILFIILIIVVIICLVGVLVYIVFKKPDLFRKIPCLSRFAPQQVGPSPQQGGGYPPYTGPPQPYPGPPQPYPGSPQPYPGSPQSYPGSPQPYPGPSQPYPGSTQPLSGPTQPVYPKPLEPQIKGTVPASGFVPNS